MTSLITVKSSILHLLSSLVLPLTLLSPSNLTFVLSPLLPVIASLKWIFSLTYVPSTFTVHCLITVRTARVASPNVQRSWERIQTHFISRAPSTWPDAYLPPIHDRTLYLAKRWYRPAMQHNRGVQDYIDNHTRNKSKNRGAGITPLDLIRN